MQTCLFSALFVFSISIDNLHADNDDDKENLALEKMDQAGIGNVAVASCGDSRCCLVENHSKNHIAFV
jgi:hypothetical protein